MPSAGNQRDIASRSNPQIHQRITPVISGNRWPQNVGINPSLAGNLANQVANCLNSGSAGARQKGNPKLTGRIHNRLLKLRDEVQGLHVCAGRVHESNIACPRIPNAVHCLGAGLVIVHVNGLDRRPKGPRPGSANENRGNLSLGHDL